MEKMIKNNKTKTILGQNSNAQYCLIGKVEGFFDNENNIGVLKLYVSTNNMNEEIAEYKIFLKSSGTSTDMLFLDFHKVKDVNGNNNTNRVNGVRAYFDELGTVSIYLKTKNVGQLSFLVIDHLAEGSSFTTINEFSETFNTPDMLTDHSIGGWVLAR